MKITQHLRLPTRRRESAAGPPPKPSTAAIPARRRPRYSPSSTRFTVRTRLGRALGKAESNNRYQVDAVRVLPGPKRDRVIVQATDGHQAVCVVVPGRCDEPTLVPGGVLPTRKPVTDVEVHDDQGNWQCSDGRLVEKITAPKKYPSIGEVLPVVTGKGVKPHITVALDLTVLGKVADALGTPKLTLIITPPENGSYVNRALAVCPAGDDAGVHGVAVVMPITPKHQADYYTKVRKDVVAAENRYTPKPAPTTTN